MHAGEAPAKARALRCRADALTAAGEALGAAQVLAAVAPPDQARLGRLREAQGRLEDAAETFEQAGMPAAALRNWRNAGKWEQAVRLAAGAERPGMAPPARLTIHFGTTMFGRERASLGCPDAADSWPCTSTTGRNIW